MGFETDNEAPATAPDATEATQPESTKPPLSASDREKAAARARKSRALKKLKGAKTEKQLREAAAEVAEPNEPPAWPSKQEIVAEVAELAPLVAMAADELRGTPWALDEKRQQILTIALAPAAAQARKSPEISAVAEYVPPWLIAVGGLLFVFGPPTFREIRAMMDDSRPKPQPPAPQPEAPSAMEPKK